ELIERNRERHADRPNMEFRHGDVTCLDTPSVDAVFCRDCLVHLPFEDAMRGLSAMADGGRARYLFLTTFPGWLENRDIKQPGKWRALDLTSAPFNLPEPFRLIRERAPNPDDRNNMKSIGIWESAAVRLAVQAHDT